MMVINNVSQPTVRAGDVPVGDAFIYSGAAFIRCALQPTHVPGVNLVSGIALQLEPGERVIHCPHTSIKLYDPPGEKS